MRTSHAFAAALLTLGFGLSVQGQSFQQIPLPYNADIVREVGGTVTGGLDNQGRAYVTQGEAALRDTVDPRGLPDNGLLSVPGGTLQLRPYNENNVLLMTASDSPRFGVTGAQAEGYDFLEVYAASSGGAARVWAFYDNAGSNGFVGATPPDWTADGAYEAERYLIDGMDRTGPQGLGFEDVDDVAIYRYRLHLRGASPLNSLTLYFDPFVGPGIEPARAAVFGAALTTIPEPTGLGGVLLMASLMLRRGRK